jgi:hypothetical protein
MNTKLNSFLLAIIFASVIAVWSFSRDTKVINQAASATSALDHSRPAIESGALRHDAAPQDANTDTPEAELVMGIPVRKDRNCSVQRHYMDLGNGTVTEAYSCVPQQAAIDDYEQYSDEQLRVLSYSDAKAASTLGKRLVEVNLAESRALLLRAVALQPSNSDPVMWLVAQAHSLRGDSPAAQRARANTYVLTRTAQALGRSAPVDWITEDLQVAGFGDKQVMRLDEHVKANLRRIREIQLEVFGESVVDEVLL